MKCSTFQYLGNNELSCAVGSVAPSHDAPQKVLPCQLGLYRTVASVKFSLNISPIGTSALFISLCWAWVSFEVHPMIEGTLLYRTSKDNKTSPETPRVSGDSELFFLVYIATWLHLFPITMRLYTFWNPSSNLNWWFHRLILKCLTESSNHLACGSRRCVACCSSGLPVVTTTSGTVK